MKRVFSKLLNEYMNVADDGSATFDSGVVYTADQMLMLRKTGASAGDIIAIHRVMSVFDGEDLEYSPGVAVIPEFTKKKIKEKPVKTAQVMDPVLDPESSAVQMSLF